MIHPFIRHTVSPFIQSARVSRSDEALEDFDEQRGARPGVAAAAITAVTGTGTVADALHD